VAVLYEIGRRHADRREWTDGDEPVSQEDARAAYRARISGGFFGGEGR
jgi:hypothetical protein